MTLIYFAALTAAFVLGNLLSDVLVAAYVTWRTKQARRAHLARAQQYQEDARTNSVETPGGYA